MSEQNYSLLINNIAKDRCAESFKTLFKFYAPKIYSFGLKGRLSESQARDLVQEVMTTVWIKASLFDEKKGDASGWIFTVARNSRFDMFRKSTRERNKLASEEIWSLENIAEDSSDLEEKVRGEQLKDHVLKLPKEQKEAIEFIYYEGLTHEEYAQRHNVPLGTVKSRVRLALKKLNEVMKI